jgi:hypothetical protein
MNLPPELWHPICKHLEIGQLSELYKACIESSRSKYIAEISSQEALGTLYFLLLQSPAEIELNIGTPGCRKHPSQRGKPQLPRFPTYPASMPIHCFCDSVQGYQIHSSLSRRDSQVRLEVKAKSDINIAMFDLGNASDPCLLLDISFQFIASKQDPGLGLWYFSSEKATVLEEKVDTTEVLYRALRQRLDLQYVLWYEREETRILPKEWIEDLLGKGLRASITIPPDPIPGRWLQMHQVDMMTDFFRIPTSKPLLQLFPGNLKILTEIFKEGIDSEENPRKGSVA